MDCIFCKIINNEIPAEKIYESDNVIAFNDINPVAPVHILIIPKKHIENLNDITVEDRVILSDLLLAAKDIAAKQGLDESGYRVITNNGKSAGQEVFHLHMHLIGGRDSLGPMISR